MITSGVRRFRAGKEICQYRWRKGLRQALYSVIKDSYFPVGRPCPKDPMHYPEVALEPEGESQSLEYSAFLLSKAMDLFGRRTC